MYDDDVVAVGGRWLGPPGSGNGQPVPLARAQGNTQGPARAETRTERGAERKAV